MLSFGYIYILMLHSVSIMLPYVPTNYLCPNAAPARDATYCTTLVNHAYTLAESYLDPLEAGEIGILAPFSIPISVA
jgi:hypothetical protein